jgi:hypothetical protein
MPANKPTLKITSITFFAHGGLRQRRLWDGELRPGQAINDDIEQQIK